MGLSLSYINRMNVLGNKLYDKQWLEEQYNNGRTIQSIADELSVHNETVRTKFDKFGIKRRKNVAQDMTGRVFERLTAIKSIAPLPEHKGKSAGLFWKCKCTCGNETVVSGKNLRQGNVRSCGCLLSEVTKKLRKDEALSRYGKSSKKQVLSHYKRNAKRANRGFNIDSETFYALTQMPCYFCGSVPSNLQRNTNNNGDYSYNGLDRLDSTLGYEIVNVVPCCKKCNIAKHVMSLSEFKEWIELVYNHLNKKIKYGPSSHEEQIIRFN